MKIFRTISAFILAFLVVVSSTNFMVGLHFCKGQVQDVALFNHAEGCQKEKSLPPCHKHMKPECCNDEVVYHEATDLKASTEQLQLDAPVPVTLEQPSVIISEIIPVAEISRTTYYNYDPPLRSCDRTVALQVFLI